jgi:2-polyprenyl-3-methyl-5-hydroxy-6-metoxy-1,4-benzoquinol methylase
MHAGNVVIGHRLGLYRALGRGPATPTDLARRSGCHSRYVAEWLRGQAAGGYVDVDAQSEKYSLNEEQAFALTDPDGEVYLPGAFLLALASLRAEPRITEAFQSGEGLGWHEHHDEVFVGYEQFCRPGYVTNLLSVWLPALDGVVAKLETGARVADVGCGLGTTTVLMASAYGRSKCSGSDYLPPSIELARKRAAEAGVANRVVFEVASAQTFTGDGCDLVTTFDSLHDMGDPLTAATHVRRTLANDGTWMIVEPAAADDYNANLNAVGRLYYGISTFLCLPNALSQRGGFALGAQAGEGAIGRIVTDAGFTRFRRATETAFHIVYEARP